MARNPSSEPARLAEGWQAIFVAAGALALVELCRLAFTFGALAFGPLGAVRSVLAVVLGFLFVVALHHGLVWTVVALALRRVERNAVLGVMLGLAFGYGWLWEATVTSGDGLAASEWGGVIKALLGLGIPLGLVALVRFVFWPGYVSERARRVVLAGLLAVAITVTLFVLPEYRAFHGFLAGFEVALIALLVAGRPSTRVASLAFLGVALVAIPVLAPRAAAALGSTRRYTRLPGTMLEALPVTRALLPKVRPFVDPTALPPGDDRTPPPDSAPLVARGDSVLLVVLEATRSDTWSDPAIAPEFAGWRSHGLYVPRAVSQYPATPLAYGAIFTSQPPSIVAQSSHWSRHRLFERLAPRFRSVFLTQPAERWFDTGAMTSFLVRDASAVRRHKSTGSALGELRGFLEREAGHGSYFAWAHLFDAHKPYRARGSTPRDAPPAERYRSEVHAVDAELGRFMRWFYAQPFAGRTLVLVVADHGEAMGEILDGEPYIGHHVHVADGIAHVPFYASGSGLPLGVTERELGVCQLDVMPTIFDYLGVALPPELAVQGLPLPRLLAERPLRSLPTEAFSIRGRDFFAFVGRAGGTSAAEQRQLFREMWESGTYAPKLAIERGRWKIVRDAVSGEDALYDLQADPRETRNVAANRPVELRAMRAALEAWRLDEVRVLHRLDRLP